MVRHVAEISVKLNGDAFGFLFGPEKEPEQLLPVLRWEKDHLVRKVQVVGFDVKIVVRIVKEGVRTAARQPQDRRGHEQRPAVRQKNFLSQRSTGLVGGVPNATPTSRSNGTVSTRWIGR